MRRMGLMVTMVHDSLANIVYEFELAAYTNLSTWPNGPGKEVDLVQPRFEVSCEYRACLHSRHCVPYL